MCQSFQDEINRIRDILQEYILLGQCGRIGVTWVSQVIQEAEKASLEGDNEALASLRLRMQKIM